MREGARADNERPDRTVGQLDQIALLVPEAPERERDWHGG